MIRVSRHTPPADDARKAEDIVAAGGSAIFAGDPRHLRRIESALADRPAVSTYLGNVEVSDDDVVGRSAILICEPSDGEVEAGTLAMDHVPR